MHDLHVDENLGPVIASSYRFQALVDHNKNYDAEDVAGPEKIGAVNTLIVLSPLKNLHIEVLRGNDCGIR